MAEAFKQLCKYGVYSIAMHIGSASVALYPLCVFPDPICLLLNALEGIVYCISQSCNRHYTDSLHSYYIHPSTYLDGKPILLVPLHQFQDLIDKINEHYKGTLVIPTDPDLGFVVPFYNDGTPSPTYLGCGKDRDHISEMEADIPDPKKGYGETPAGANSQVDLSFAAFKKKMETVAEANKRKSKTLKKKRTQDRVAQQQEWCRGLKRAQRYLGLRPRVTGSGTPYRFDASMSWAEEQQLKQEYAVATGRALEPLDLNKPAPYPFDEKPIIIAIDVESNERDHNQITEVGVSTLDTLDLEGVPPGDGGRNWMSLIRSRHFRIGERMYIVNKDFCPGDPLKFHFGTFEKVSITQIGEVFDECFEWPFSVNFKHSGDFTRSEEAHEIESNDRQAVYEEHGSETTGIPDRDASSITTDFTVPAALASSVTGVLEHDLESFAITDPTMKAAPTNADQAAANDAVAHALLGIDKIDTQVDSQFWNSESQTLGLLTEDSLASPDLPLGKPTAPETTGISRVAIDVNDRRLKVSAERKGTTVASLLNAAAHQKGSLDRKIILVGHDLPSDIHYLRLLPSTILDPNKEGSDGQHIHPTILESLDTTHMHKVLVRETQSRSLAHLLVELGITGWDLHNAGNDARYTLEAFIGIALKDRLHEDKRKASSKEEQDAANAAWEAEVQKRVDEKRQEAEDLIRTEMAIWDAATGQPRTPSDDERNPNDSVLVNKENTAAPWMLDNDTTFQNDDDHDGGEPTGWNVEPEKQGKSKGSKKSASQKKREAEEWFNEYMKGQIKKEKAQVEEEVAVKGSGWD